MLPIEKATYRAKATGASFGFTADGKPQLAIFFRILTDGFAGETIPAILHFTDKTTERSLESLLHMGLASDDLELLADISEAEAAELLPNEVDLVCEPEEWDGRQRLRVRWINRAGGGRFAFQNKMEGSHLKAFAAQMRGELKNLRGGASAQRKQAAPASTGRQGQRHPNAPGNDDIPF